MDPSPRLGSLRLTGSTFSANHGGNGRAIQTSNGVTLRGDKFSGNCVTLGSVAGCHG